MNHTNRYGQDGACFCFKCNIKHRASVSATAQCACDNYYVIGDGEVIKVKRCYPER